jgi:thiopurine S-methyltransferase
MHPAGTAAFWQDRWATGQIGFHEGTPNAFLTHFWPGLDAGTRVLVPLCGKSADLAWLAARGHDVTGVELSEVAARAFFEERSLEPSLHRVGPFLRLGLPGLAILVGDIFDLRAAELPAWDAWYDRAALIALPAEQRPSYAALVRASAPGGGLLVSLTRRDGAGPPFSVEDAEVQNLHPGARLLLRRASDEARWRDAMVEETVWSA